MQASDPTPNPDSNAPRVRSFDDNPALAAQAAAVLRKPRIGLPMADDELRQVLAHMRLVTFPRGAALFREGEGDKSSHLLLLLEGEVSVDTGDTAPAEAVAISVLGPGSVIGEMTLLDGAPRSANCTALSTVMAGGMSRQGLEQLIQDHPRAAAKLLVVLSQFTIERLRALSQQLQIYAQLNDKLRSQLQGRA